MEFCQFHISNLILLVVLAFSPASTTVKDAQRLSTDQIEAVLQDQLDKIRASCAEEVGLIDIPDTSQQDDKFVVMKTPLDERYDNEVPAANIFHPSMVFQSAKNGRIDIGMWIDLTNTARFYDGRNINELALKYRCNKSDSSDPQTTCVYTKIRCRGHGECPSDEQVNLFVFECRKFFQRKPLEKVAVHCTHGFNRSGFMIISYLVQVEDWSPDAAVEQFAVARPPGVYKADYLQEIFRRFGDTEDTPIAPDLPDWCFEDNDSCSERIRDEPSTETGESSMSGFMPGVSGVALVQDKALARELQSTLINMFRGQFRSKSGFPGSQPVSMDRQNMAFLESRQYQVSWKADGTRYMMLILDAGRVYFVDRKAHFYQSKNVTFLHRKNPTQHLKNTLLDGEMVIDEEPNGNKRPRYLVYDIVKFEGEDVGKTNFKTRALCIGKEIVDTRSKYIAEGRIDKTVESFSIRQKQFWPIEETHTLLGPKFCKASLGHEPDGLIFQPTDHPYTPGRDDLILKWKPSSHNSVDFRLKVVRENRPGMLAATVGHLFVVDSHTPFAVMPKLSAEVRRLDGAIIECTFSFEANQWQFMRQRTDKTHANSYRTTMAVVKSMTEPVTESMLLDYIDRMTFKRPELPRPHHQSNHGPQSHHNSLPSGERISASDYDDDSGPSSAHRARFN